MLARQVQNEEQYRYLALTDKTKQVRPPATAQREQCFFSLWVLGHVQSTADPAASGYPEIEAPQVCFDKALTRRILDF